MTIKKILLPVIILAVFLLGALLLAGYQPDRQTRAAAPPGILVETQSLQIETVSVQIESQGTVQPSTETTLVSEVSGLVTGLSPVFVAGGVFRKGDVLIRLDPLDYAVSVRQAEAALAASQARLTEEQARRQAEAVNWRQSGRPLADAPPLLLREPFIAEADANVKAAQAELDKARLYLGKTEIRAPYDGMVKSRQADIGQYVSPGTPLGVTFATESAEVRLPVTASSLPLLDIPAFGSIANGPSVTLTAQFGSQAVQWKGDIVRSEGVVEGSTRMHVLVAEVHDPYGMTQRDSRMPLKAGLFVRASITGISLDSVQAVPRSLIRRNNEVLVADKGVMRLRQVNVRYASAGMAYVDSGFQAGDRLITTVLEDPLEGIPIIDRSQSDGTGEG
ncbi:efflux RND transporter periplasmic adaptor subunit [Kistimonas scapharcae]|uniref:Efflux RND transporter periplasmic adaptor subunit n=1 Tax=Kistimonas scapharcae TaxID=1036133 RepID=A0ABP8V2C4_9GAMM